MQQDGDDITKQKAELSLKIRRYESLLDEVTEAKDPAAFKLFTDIVADCKHRYILLNTPEDQLRNLRAAIARKNKLSVDLANQINSLMETLAEVKSKLAIDLQREQTLIAMTTIVPLAELHLTDHPMVINSPQYQHMQQSYEDRLCNMAETLRQKEAQWANLCQGWNQQQTAAQSVLGIPEDVIRLMPVIAPVTFAAPPSPATASLIDHMQVAFHAAPATPVAAFVDGDSEHDFHDPNALLSGYESMSLNAQEVDEIYGAAQSTSAARSSPYAGGSEAPFLEPASTDQPAT